MRKKGNTKLFLQIIITSVAIIGIIIHSVLPSFTIDAITITLIVIAIFPWLQPLIKSFELPGGWKIEYQDIQKARQKAEGAGLLSPQPRGGGPGGDTIFPLSEKDDPILVFSGLLLEIESKLWNLSSPHRLPVYKMTIWDLLTALQTVNVLSNNEAIALKDVISILYSGIHGADINKEALDWALNIGPRIIGVLIDKGQGLA